MVALGFHRPRLHPASAHGAALAQGQVSLALSQHGGPCPFPLTFACSAPAHVRLCPITSHHCTEQRPLWERPCLTQCWPLSLLLYL